MNKGIRTYEELVMSLVNEAIFAIHKEQDYYFDNIMESIEILLRVVPDMYNDFQKKKAELYQSANQNYNQAIMSLQQYDDEVYRSFIKNKEDSEISWSYRKDILEEVIVLLSKYNKIAFTHPEHASIDSIDSASLSSMESTQQPPAKIQSSPQLQQTPQPQVQQPIKQTQIQHPPQPQFEQHPKEQNEISDEQLRQLLEVNQKPKQKSGKSKWSSLISNRNP